VSVRDTPRRPGVSALIRPHTSIPASVREWKLTPWHPTPSRHKIDRPLPDAFWYDRTWPTEGLWGMHRHSYSAVYRLCSLSAKWPGGESSGERIGQRTSWTRQANSMTNYCIGPHQTTSNYIGPHRTTSDHIWPNLYTSNKPHTGA